MSWCWNPIEDKSLEDCSRDGRFILYNIHSVDIGVMPLFGDRKPAKFLATPFAEVEAQWSLDGRWIAYTSNESGRAEVYVQSFPPAGGKWQISTQGGRVARWRADGKELFYISGQKMMAVEVKARGQEFEAGIPKALFEAPLGAIYRNPYVVVGSGQRFLINTPVEEAASPITLVVNWTAGLRR